MEEKKVNKHENRNKFLTPELYPVYYNFFKKWKDLIKKPNDIKVVIEEEKSKEIGKIAINLIKRTNNSIYKILYSTTNQHTNDDLKRAKNIRNMFFKQLVESNEEYFAKELKNDKFKRNINHGLRKNSIFPEEKIGGMYVVKIFLEKIKKIQKNLQKIDDNNMHIDDASRKVF